MRFLNTEGPVNCQKHYCLPPLERFDLIGILSLIEQEKYFVLHAPRQTGKTSCLLALMAYLNERGKFRCLYCNVEPAQVARENVQETETVELSNGVNIDMDNEGKLIGIEILGATQRYPLSDIFNLTTENLVLDPNALTKIICNDSISL